jgi:hypothetical protein
MQLIVRYRKDPRNPDTFNILNFKPRQLPFKTHSSDTTTMPLELARQCAVLVTTMVAYEYLRRLKEEWDEE